MPNHHQQHGAGSSDELKGLDILLVEDSRDAGRFDNYETNPRGLPWASASPDIHDWGE